MPTVTVKLSKPEFSKLEAMATASKRTKSDVLREALAKSLGVTPETIHLKAKTNEGVDAIGRGEAIAAYVVATLSMV